MEELLVAMMQSFGDFSPSSLKILFFSSMFSKTASMMSWASFTASSIEATCLTPFLAASHFSQAMSG